MILFCVIGLKSDELFKMYRSNIQILEMPVILKRFNQYYQLTNSAEILCPRMSVKIWFIIIFNYNILFINQTIPGKF